MLPLEQTPLYVRFKGRVLGPYDREHLEQQVARGQLSRLHEVSEDGVMWVRAARYPLLFDEHAPKPQPALVETPPAQPPETAARSAIDHNERPPQQGPAANSLWYYARGDREHEGPVLFEELQVMSRRGELDDCSAVWSDGLADWVSPDKVPGLSASCPRHEVAAAPSYTPAVYAPAPASEREISLEVCRILAATRPWVLFCSILGFIYAVLVLIGAILNFARAGSFGVARPVMITAGLTSLVLAALVGIGAGLLLNYSSRIGTLVMYKGPRHLDQVLQAARFFWQYVGIVLIVLLTSVIVLVIGFVAVVGSL